MSEQIILNKYENIVELKMNFNETNTITYDSFQYLNESLEKAESDPDIKVLLLTSNAPGFFSNGLDPNMFIGRSEADIRKAAETIITSASKYHFFPYPTIAVISGHSMGAGSVFSISSDFRLMAEKRVRLSFPEGMIAMNFPAFSARVLQDIVGANHATDILLNAKALKSLEALKIGLVDYVHPNEELFDAAMKFAKKLASKPKESLTGIKKSLRQGYHGLAKNVKQWDIDEMVKTILSDNAQEGFLSIKEKRRPQFK